MPDGFFSQGDYMFRLLFPVFPLSLCYVHTEKVQPRITWVSFVLAFCFFGGAGHPVSSLFSRRVRTFPFVSSSQTFSASLSAPLLIELYFSIGFLLSGPVCFFSLSSIFSSESQGTSFPYLFYF